MASAGCRVEHGQAAVSGDRQQRQQDRAGGGELAHSPRPRRPPASPKRHHREDSKAGAGEPPIPQALLAWRCHTNGEGDQAVEPRRCSGKAHPRGWQQWCFAESMPEFQRHAHHGGFVGRQLDRRVRPGPRRPAPSPTMRSRAPGLERRPNAWMPQIASSPKNGSDVQDAVT